MIDVVDIKAVLSLSNYALRSAEQDPRTAVGNITRLRDYLADLVEEHDELADLL